MNIGIHIYRLRERYAEDRLIEGVRGELHTCQCLLCMISRTTTFVDVIVGMVCLNIDFGNLFARRMDCTVPGHCLVGPTRRRQLRGMN